MSCHLFPAQTLADRRLHPVCHALLRLRHLRHVPVLLAQVAGQRSRGGAGGGRGRVKASRRGRLPAQGEAHGAAPRLHGGLLLPCITGNYGNT